MQRLKFCTRPLQQPVVFLQEGASDFVIELKDSSVDLTASGEIPAEDRIEPLDLQRGQPDLALDRRIAPPRLGLAGRATGMKRCCPHTGKSAQQSRRNTAPHDDAWQTIS